MGQMHAIKLKIDELIAKRGLDSKSTRGAIGLKAGYMLGFINPNTPDDPETIEKLRKAVELVLNTRI